MAPSYGDGARDRKGEGGQQDTRAGFESRQLWGHEVCGAGMVTKGLASASQGAVE